MVDKSDFPREKLCAGGITVKAQKIIDRTYGNIGYNSKDINTITMYINGKVKNEFKLKNKIRVVNRTDFDNRLHQEYLKLGGEFIVDRIQDYREAGDLIAVTMESGKSYTCNYLVGADGALSFVRKQIERVDYRSMLCIEQHTTEYKGDKILLGFEDNFKSGYSFAFPNEEYTSIGYLDKNTNSEKLEEIVDYFGFESVGRTKGAFIPIQDKMQYLFKDNIILIGDAGGYVDSFSGEGIYYALATGINAARSIITGKRFKRINKWIIAKVRLLKVFARIMHSKVGKVAFKVLVGNGWLSTKVLNFYIGW